MAARYTKPKGMKYTDLCIYIDNNIYKPNCDINLIFQYMYIIAYMLASKAKYFTNLDDYDEFAYYLALAAYKRMTDKDKVPIKSVLNYMKSIMYWRKVSFQKETFNTIIDPDYDKSWDSDLYKEKTIRRLENNNKEQLSSLVSDLLKQVPLSVKNNIPKTYRKDKVIFKNLYISVLYTLLYNFTLPKVNEDYLREKELKSSTFNNTDYYNKHLGKEIILWHLPQQMESAVTLVVNKVKLDLLNDIRDLISDYKMSEQEYKNVFNDIIFGDNNETFEGD